jgi:hypothetical protein
MIVEHKHDDSVNELFTGNKYTPDAQITFLRKQFQLLYGDLEREYINNCDECQVSSVLILGNAPRKFINAFSFLNSY